MAFSIDEPIDLLFPSQLRSERDRLESFTFEKKVKYDQQTFYRLKVCH